MSISAKLIAESYKGFKVKAVTKDRCGFPTLWNVIPIFDGGDWVSDDEYTDVYGLDDFEITEFIGKEPKDCIYVVEAPIDYSKWVDKLCWFWDDDESSTTGRVGILTDVIKYGRLIFKKDGEANFQNCRPVRRDEVQFVED